MMNVNNKIVLPLILAAVLIVNGCTSDRNDSPQPQSEKLDYEVKTSPGEVTIDLIPERYENKVLYVTGYFNTHTVDLARLNLRDTVRLKTSNNEIMPLQVPRLNGHHSSGTFVFNIEEMPDSFSILIKGVPDIEERIMTWP
jgi:hypothetical protein